MIEAPATSGQSLLWFLARRGGEGIGLNCPVLFRVSGPVNPAHLRGALTCVVRRHAALRTGLVRRGRKLVQVISDTFVPSVRVVDPVADDEALREMMSEEILLPVALDRPSLRALIVPSGTETHVCLSMHHAISDGWSGQVIFDDLAKCYGGAVLPPLPGFERVAEREAEYLASPLARRDAARLAAALSAADFDAVPLDRNSPARIGRSEQRRATLDTRVASRLSAFAATSGFGDFAVHLAVYFATLRLSTGTRHPGVATLYANRTDPDFARMVGYFVSLQYLTVAVRDRTSLRDLVDCVADRARDASLRQRFPLHLASMDRSGQAARADDCVFQLLPYRFSTREFGGGWATPYLPPVQPRRFDFEVTAVTGEDAAQIIVNWNADRLQKTFVETFIDVYSLVASALADDPDQPLIRLA